MILFAVVISIFFLVGIGLLGKTLYDVRHSLQASNWPTVPGTLSDVSISRHRGSKGGFTYRVEVKYSYQVDGKPLESTNLAFGYAATSGREAHEEIRKTLEGAKSVSVRYNPADPSEACLSYGFHRSLQFLLAFAITWLAFTIGMCVIFWISSRSDDVLLRNLAVQ